MNYENIIIIGITVVCIGYLYQKLFRKKGDCGCGGGGNCNSKKK
ncbi:FeoB-associated Cys-rich membrane protein [Arcobacter sp. CECT 8985]|nr:FeoB-associated Cys-rich membrane protein [Arcobacter sp. CECT 8985]